MQGAGQVFGEHAIYDAATAQFLTGSFMDYVMPRAGWLRDIEVHDHPVPTPTNALGAKGVGESGCSGSLPALVERDDRRVAPARHRPPRHAVHTFQTVGGNTRNEQEWRKKVTGHRGPQGARFECAIPRKGFIVRRGARGEREGSDDLRKGPVPRRLPARGLLAFSFSLRNIP